MKTIPIVLAVLLSLFALKATDDNPHGKMPEGMDCSDCHSSETWRPARDRMNFDHARQTRFVLTGAHRRTSCRGCHVGLRFDQPRIVGDGCVDCHLDVHQATFDDRCSTCHNTRSFKDVDGIAVHLRTAFPLTGAHVHIPCEACHQSDRNGALTRIPGDCASCHEFDYHQAMVPNHDAAGYSMLCEQCHDTDAWFGAVFDHAASAHGYELVDVHADLACASCHRMPMLEPLFSPASQNDCFSCHSRDFASEHGPGWPTECLFCHNQRDWEAEEFDHVAASAGYELVDAHARLSCASCHQLPGLGLIFRPQNQYDCLTCHGLDFSREHGPGWPTDCLLCHDQARWEETAFDHAAVANGYGLDGAHAAASCGACHRLPGLDLLFNPNDQNDCRSCHMADFNAAHDPSWPFACADCHNTSSWEGTSFNHDAAYFPINTGEHAGTWSTCATCHTQPGRFEVFSCLTCHEHAQARMDDEHRDESGYAYNSVLCLGCHPRGNKEEDD